MTVTVKVLYTGGQLTNAAATLFTSPTNTTTVITNATFTNVDSGARLLTVWVVRSGGSASASNIIIGASAAGFSLASGQAYVSPELAGVVLAAGDFIQAKADANSVITVAEISGYYIS